MNYSTLRGVFIVSFNLNFNIQKRSCDVNSSRYNCHNAKHTSKVHLSCLPCNFLLKFLWLHKKFHQEIQTIWWLSRKLR